MKTLREKKLQYLPLQPATAVSIATAVELYICTAVLSIDYTKKKINFPKVGWE